MSDPEVAWKGIVMGLVAGVGAKLLACVWVQHRFLIGWAMCGRAEFAYLIAQMAVSKKMMSDTVYGMTVWALFVATISAPFGFNHYLKKLASIVSIDDIESDEEV